MTTSKSSKATLQLRLRALSAGTAKHFTNGSLTFNGASTTPAQLTQAFQSLDDATTSMDAARAKWQDAVKVQRSTSATVRPLVKAYRSYLVNLYGDASATLGDFGMTPRKAPAPRTAAQKATAAARNKATRAARHTMGPKQKAGIKGTVAVTAPAAPAPAPAKPITQ
jgi:hypothetical protein